MKKSWLILFLCLCLCCLSACGDPSDGPEQPAPVATAPTETEQTGPDEDVLTVEATPEPSPAPVTVNGQTVLPDAETLTLEGAVMDPGQLADALGQLKNLRSVTLTRTVPDNALAAWSRDWDALLTALPNISFTFRDLYHGEEAETVTDLRPDAGFEPTEEELQTVLSVFSGLRSLDLQDVAASREAAAYVASLSPDITVRWNDAVFGPSESAAEALTLSGAFDEQTAEAYLACFPHLAEADLRGCELPIEDSDALMKAFPAVAFRRTVTLNGQSLDSFTEELDLSKAQIADYEAFSEELLRFPRLSRLEMHYCSLSNEQLAALRERYPGAGIVWTVKFRKWSVRTDAVAFSTMQLSPNSNRLRSDEVQVLQYCTDLVALDLGHNNVSDLEWLRPLQKLQVLILAENNLITDVTPIGALTKLKYVELFMNPIEDISPLANLPDLLDVNLCLTKITDVTPLLSCTKLERIWLGRDVTAQIGQDAVDALLNAFPEAQFDLDSRSSTYNGWREHPRYDAYIKMFRTNTVVPPFVPED